MTEGSLKVPLLLNPTLPLTTTTIPSIPATPTHIASWLVPSTEGAGPSRRTALADNDNTVWIVTVSTSRTELPGASASNGLLSPEIPSLHTSSGSEPASPLYASRKGRPSAQRNSSYSGRPRNTSSASSVLSNGRRRTSAFSPPPSALQLPTTTLSAATASAAPADSHTHGHQGSLSERAELLDSLREQRERKDDASSMVGLGLGLGGIGRRGLTGVHGKEDHVEHSGATSPRSTGSVGTEPTSRFGLFGRGSVSNDDDREKELREQMSEIQVDREMEQERKEDQREKEDLRMVEAAIERSPTPMLDYDTRRSSAAEPPTANVKRLLLRSMGQGKIVQMKVFEDVRVLCILRDEGLLDVFSLSTLECTASIQLESPEKPVQATGSAGDKNGPGLTPFWLWRDVHLARSGDTSMLVAHGTPWPCALPSPNGQVTRVVMMVVSAFGRDISFAARLELPGEGDVAICESGDSRYLLHCTASSLTSYPIIFPITQGSQTLAQPRASPQIRAVSAATPSVPVRAATPEPSRTHDSSHPLRKSASHTHLRDSASTPLLGSSHDADQSHSRDKDGEKGFAKFLAARRADWVRKPKEEGKSEAPAPGIGEGKEVERDGGGGWGRFKIAAGEGAGWSHETVDTFTCDGTKLNVKASLTVTTGEHVRDVCFVANRKRLVVQTQDQAIIYEPIQGGQGVDHFESATTFGNTTSMHLESSGRLSLVQSGRVRTIELELLLSGAQARDAITLTDTARPAVTQIHPVDVEGAFLADAQGNVTYRSLSGLLSNEESGTEADGPTCDRLESRITCLRTITSERGPRFLVAGDEDGILRVWTAEPFRQCGSFTLFADPIKSVALLDIPQAGSLDGCLLAVSEGGTIGIVSLKDMDDLYLIPASRTPLRRVFIESKDILLAYANGKARVWNTRTQEFRRSTGLDAAEDMLATGDWVEVSLWNDMEPNAFTSVVTGVHEGSEMGRLLQFDLIQLGHWLGAIGVNERHSPLPALRSLLSMFLAFGVDDAVDELCELKLQVPRPDMPVLIGHASALSSELSYASKGDVWRVSSQMTALRQLVIVALLRPFLDSPQYEEYAAGVIAYHTTSLPAYAIESELDFFADHYLAPSADIHQAARMLFAARVARLSGSEIEAIVDANQAMLPSQVPSAFKVTAEALKALTLLGAIALHKYQSMQPSTLKAIAESVALLLQEPGLVHQPLAVELCSKGFTTWQLYVDPSDLLRRLFHLSTHKDFSASTSGSGGASIAAQARLAVLHVASTNPPLFMSTLSMDILDAQSAEGRKSIMKLCVFMARKKPAVLENGLPRIAEAVVKSLDPNVGKMRNDVQQAATVILHELVIAYSTIDFHNGTQRLAVGTHEGAVIMYDLKTASRLYVLEPHKQPVSAVTFSPDGRRLVTVSLDEGDVTVWKVGSSLSGFFSVGAPPRQGGEKGGPFKRIEFIRAVEDTVVTAPALSDVQITWPGARQARVTIKETQMTFET
ncbi:hypothetical protein IAU60_005277 [Kwoniella sp. DSM 27419]